MSNHASILMIFCFQVCFIQFAMIFVKILLIFPPQKKTYYDKIKIMNFGCFFICCICFNFLFYFNALLQLLSSAFLLFTCNSESQVQSNSLRYYNAERILRVLRSLHIKKKTKTNRNENVNKSFASNFIHFSRKKNNF